MFLKGHIITGGWSHKIVSFTDTREAESVAKEWSEQRHKEDILCMTHCEPNILVSGSFDGDILVWNADSERKTCSLNYSHVTEQKCHVTKGKCHVTEGKCHVTEGKCHVTATESNNSVEKVSYVFDSL